jgi:hypothetical protein
MAPSGNVRAGMVKGCNRFARPSLSRCKVVSIGVTEGKST